MEVQGATVDNIAVGNNMFAQNGTKSYVKTQSAPVTNEDVRNYSGQLSSATGMMTILKGNTSGTAAHGLPEAPSRVIVSACGDPNVGPSTLGTSGVVINRSGSVGDLIVD